MKLDNLDLQFLELYYQLPAEQRRVMILSVVLTACATEAIEKGAQV